MASRHELTGEKHTDRPNRREVIEEVDGVHSDPSSAGFTVR